MLAPEDILRGAIMVIFSFVEILNVIKASDKQRNAHLPNKVNQGVAPVELMIMYPA